MQSIIDWSRITLVVFDVDGTLYNQKKLRLLMARDLLLHSLRTLNASSITILKSYRQIRERLGEEEANDFQPLLVAQVAAACGVTEQEVERIVSEWIQQRPLPYLQQCRFHGLPELFDRLRKRGKRIGVLSDYPAEDKLAALGLSADFIVSADDAEVNILKPNPRGLQRLMTLAGGTPASTVMIGDRIERDGFAAQRSGVRCLIKSSRKVEGWHTFTAYDETTFGAVF